MGSRATAALVRRCGNSWGGEWSVSYDSVLQIDDIVLWIQNNCMQHILFRKVPEAHYYGTLGPRWRSPVSNRSSSANSIFLQSPPPSNPPLYIAVTF